MKKEKIIFKSYKDIDSNFYNILELHKSILEDTIFEDVYIYYDNNFKTYFSSLIGKENEYINILEIDNTIRGFIHLRLINDTLFLNNIAIDKKLKGLGLGKGLFKFTLLDFKNHFNPNTPFKLDVFNSNKIAHRWYKKLGFNVESSKNWYLIKNSANYESKPQKIISKCVDKNGFTGFYIGNNKGATKVNQNLIIHNGEFVKNLDLSKYNKIISDDKNILEVSNLGHEFITLIDTSYRMNNTLKTILNSI